MTFGWGNGRAEHTWAHCDELAVHLAGFWGLLFPCMGTSAVRQAKARGSGYDQGQSTSLPGLELGTNCNLAPAQRRVAPFIAASGNPPHPLAVATGVQNKSSASSHVSHGPAIRSQFLKKRPPRETLAENVPHLSNTRYFRSWVLQRRQTVLLRH